MLAWFIMWLWLAVPGAVSADPTAATLHLQVSGITQQAPLIVLLFRRDGWLHDEQAVQRLHIPADKYDSLSCTLVDIPFPDRYAIEAFLDLNDNGKLDMHWFPIPSPDEPVGFSNNYIPFAKPSFDKAAFRLNADNINMTIRLH